ncbi:MAG: NAD(P)H-dependent flavin oxidoreductase [Smithellaceae bacterium]
MFKTRVTEMLGIEYPIIGGTMMHLSTPEYVAAISEAGCLGLLASAMWRSKEAFREAIRRTKALTKKPFGVNLNLFPAMRQVDNNDYLDVIDEEGIEVIESSGHKAPEELVSRIKAKGRVWIHKCVGVRYAKKAASIGADIITVVGYENGGATGVLDIGTFVLIPRVVESVAVPVIGGGGVSNGRGLVAALALGAEGVIIGTRFLLTDECPIHMNLKQALVDAQETDTVLVLRTLGNTHRIWKNKTAETILELEAGNAGLDAIVKAASGEKDKLMFEKGDIQAGTISSGQGVGLCHNVKPMKAVVQDIINEAKEAAARIGKFA